MNPKDTVFYQKKTLQVNGDLLDLSTPKLMGVVNVTPDSFYDGGKHMMLQQAIDTAATMLKNGADIIDFGGYSTRPGADDVSVEEEKSRVIPVIEAFAKQFPSAIISIDSFRHEVAEKALAAGASIVNDVSGGTLDDNMFSFIGAAKVPYILTHMRGTPATMKTFTSYNHLLTDVVEELSEKMNQLLAMDVNDVIIDPGFGFAKTISQNYELLNNLSYFKILEAPLLIGVSRKSMIYKTLNIAAADALNGTTALHMAALLNGATMLRVHDVKEAKEVITLYNQLNN